MCIVEELSKAYKLDINHDLIQYHIPEGVAEKSVMSESGRIRIGLNFESRGSIRSYPGELQINLVQNLLSLGFEIYIFGLNKTNLKGFEKEILVHDFCGKTTIPELSFWINSMDLMICIDSFIAHLSNVLGVKTLVLLSVTRKGIFRGALCRRCLESGIDCSPCGEVANKCPKGFEKCRAFFHKSITPEIISHFTANECATHFSQLIQSSIKKNDQIH